MISRTGRPRAPWIGSLRGFTLIEVLLVIVLLAAAAAIAAPRFKTAYDGLRYERAIDRLEQTLRYAQSKAAIEGRTYRFVFDTFSRTYHLEVELSDDLASTTRFRREMSSRGRARRLAGEIEVYESPSEILFFPSGASTGGRFELAGNGTGRTSIEVAVVTGGITVAQEEE